MATKDFSSKQIRVSQLLASGGIPGTSVGMAIYSASNASNLEGGITDSAVFNDVGSDVFLFVSGTVGGRGTAGITAFGGDLHISGNLTVDGTSPGGGNTLDQAYDQGGPGIGREINVDSGPVQINTQLGDAFLITGSAGTQIFSKISGDDPVFTITNTEPGSGKDAKIQLQSNYDKDDIISPLSVPYSTAIQQSGESFVIFQNRAFGSAQTRGSLSIGQYDVDGLDPIISYAIIQTGSAVGTDDLVMILSGTSMAASDPNPVDFTDTSFFVSGAIGSKDGSVRGMSVFGGDVLSSGSIYATEFYGDLQGSIRFAAINDEGDSISKGQVVYIKGKQGQTPTVALAACDDPNKMPAFGLAATDAADGAAVEIVTSGDLSNYNINTLYGGVFSEGDVLYVATGSNHTSGSLTNIRPTGGENLLQNMGFVVRDGAGGDSRVKVGGAGRSNATPNLNDGQIFIGDSTNCSTTASLDLNLAYASGSGAIIGVDGQPVQLQAGSNVGLAVTGSALFGFASAEFSNGLPPLPGTDTSFFVSGSISGKGTEGTSVFGGDLHVSGNSYFSEDINLLVNKRIRFNNPGDNDQTLYGNGNTVYFDVDNTLQLQANSTIQLRTTNTAWNTFKIEAGLTSFNEDLDDNDFSISTDNWRSTFLVDAADDSIIIGHQGFSDPPDSSTVEGYGADVKIMLSGSAGSKGGGSREVVLMTGDVVISGSLHGGSPLQIGEYQPDVGTDVVLYVSGTTPSGGGGKGTPNGTTVLNSDLVVSGTYRGGYDPNAGSESFQAISDTYLFMSNPSDFGSPQIQATDSNFFFTGSIGSKGGGTPGTAVFGGDLHVSGAITADGGAPAPTYRYEYINVPNFDMKMQSSANGGCYITMRGFDPVGTYSDDKSLYITSASGSIERIVFTPVNDISNPTSSTRDFFFSGDEVTFFVVKNERVAQGDYISGIWANAGTRTPHLHLTSSDDNLVSYNFTNTAATGNVNKMMINLSSNQPYVSGSNQFDPGDILFFGAYFKARNGPGVTQNTLEELGVQLVLKYDESVTYP